MWEIHTTHYRLRDEDMDIITMIATYNIAVTDAASEILGNEWDTQENTIVTRDVLNLIDERRWNGMKQKEQNNRKQTRGFRR